MFIGVITTAVAFCICCLNPKCPMYYRRSGSYTSTVVVTQPTSQVVQTTSTSVNAGGINVNYQPAAAPAYGEDTGYQPYPAVPPTATTAKY